MVVAGRSPPRCVQHDVFLEELVKAGKPKKAEEAESEAGEPLSEEQEKKKKEQAKAEREEQQRGKDSTKGASLVAAMYEQVLPPKFTGEWTALLR